MSDPMRKNVQKLTKEQKVDIADVKNFAEELWKVLDSHENSREMALAKTKLEECVMWATKGITTPRGKK